MRILRLAVAISSVVAASLDAQVADTSVKLVVTLDRADWLYRVGDSARFTVSLTRNGHPLENASVRLELGPERMRPWRADSARGPGPWKIAGTMQQPGFLRLTARAMVEGATYSSLATAGFDPQGIEATTPMPADFDDFWSTSIADARRTPMDPRVTRLAGRSTPEVDVYHVSFQNHRVGSRLYGVLSIPSRPGKFPAVLTVPGAGVRPYFPNVDMARRGVIHLAIGIHGIPVDRDSLLYNELRATALQSYNVAGVEDRDSYYYKRVYVGVVRAGDFLFSLPQFDGINYAVEGGSQGGGLSIVAGALDSRVKAIASSYAAMSDHFGYLSGRAGGWPHIFQDTTRVRALAEKKVTLQYYDVVNFARRLRVPGIYGWGYNDNTTPPTSVHASYNVITAPKQAIVVPETGHFRTAAQRSRMDEWLLERLGVTNP
jgi:cephalosporin-C deacetylase